MTINIKTQSGSLYKVYERDGKVFVSKGALFDAEIVRLRRPIKEGGILEADLKKYNMYMEAEKDYAYIRTTKIVTLEITM